MGYFTFFSFLRLFVEFIYMYVLFIYQQRSFFIVLPGDQVKLNSQGFDI